MLSYFSLKKQKKIDEIKRTCYALLQETPWEIDSMPLTTKQIQMILDVDQHVKQVTSQGGDEIAILKACAPFILGDFNQILKASSQELTLYYEKYAGFYRLMKILETLAGGIADGSIPVPKR